MHASKWLVWGVAAGLLLLAGAAFLLVWGLESQVMEEALEGQNQYLENHFRSIVDRYAQQYLTDEGGGLAVFAEKLRTAAESNPAVLDLVVLTPMRVLVARYSRFDGGEIPCLARVPLNEPLDHEHPAGTTAASPVGCLLFPVKVGDSHRAAVLVHTMRDWLMGSARAGRTVTRTAWRLAPVFLGFYLLLGVLLVAAGRAAHRWRMRAAAAERVEALGAIADGINHEIRNPLNAVSLSLQLLGRQAAEKEGTRKIVEEADRQTRRISETIDEFVRFTRLSDLRTKRTNIADTVRDVGGPDIEVSGAASGDVDLPKLRDSLDAMFSQLSPPIQVQLEQNRHRWRVSLSGEAGGLEPGSVERLFEPYLRRRARDVGRGLALARAVFQAHGGTLTAQLKGTRLTLRGEAPRVQPGENA